MIGKRYQRNYQINEKKNFLDSSFFFPFIKIEIENVQQELIKKLMIKKDIEIFRSELTMFELSGKGSKLVNEGVLEIEDLINGINTVNFLTEVKVIPIYYSEIQTLATQFRKKHSDFIDCMILASAIYYSEVFVTLDEELKKKFDTHGRKI